MRHSNFRRVTFSLATGYIDVNEWEKVNQLAYETAKYIRARGCGFVRWKIDNTNGVCSVGFKPNDVDIDILKHQIEQLHPEVTVFVYDTANEKKNEVKKTANEE